jgi:uncharacterized protein (TIGR04168 family)
MSASARIGIVGDLHGHWDEQDARYFASAGYDLVLFTGDLGSGTQNNGVRVARSLGRLAARALVLLGNNDVVAASQIAAELGHQRGLSVLHTLTGGSHARGDVHLCGYSVHTFMLAGRTISIVAARPFSRGGGELSSPEALAESYAVGSMDDSTRKLCALIERAPGELIFLAHNGPKGLGDSAIDLWGRDFTAQAGDWGDPDLAAALAHARERERRVLAVVAGHMHSPTRDGRTRRWQRLRDDTLYLNAARVPRIFEDARGAFRHHVLLELTADAISAREVLVGEHA